LLEEPFRSREVGTPPSHFGAGDDELRFHVARALLSKNPKRGIRRAAERWLNGGERARSLWEESDGAHYLLRLNPTAEFDAEVLDKLEALARSPKPALSAHRSNPWAEWKSGDDPWWYELCDRARAASDLPLAARRRLLKEFLSANIDGRAMAIAELLPYLDSADVIRAVAAVEEAAPAVHDLHVRARVLAVASQYASEPKAEALANQSLVAARAAAEQPDGSRLGGPEPGGIWGFLELASMSTGETRRSALREAVHAWLHWVGADDPRDEGKLLRSDHRHMFHSGGDSTLPLVKLLAGEDMVAELRAFFSGLRLVAGEEGNTVEGYLAMGAWPALRDGSLELAALFVAEARTETAWQRKRAARTEQAAADSLEPLDFPEFPSELIGFRSVWR
jgi:hypothetical protein